MEPQVDVGWDSPSHPRVSSSSLLLAARQSLHSLPPSANSGSSGSGDGTEEGCPCDTPTYSTYTHRGLGVDVAGFTEQRHHEQDFCDSPFQGHMMGMGRLREEATRGSLRISSPSPRALGHVSPAQVRGLHWSQGTADPAVNKVATAHRRCGLCPHPTPPRL